jgi:hypothetical protein
VSLIAHVYCLAINLSSAAAELELVTVTQSSVPCSSDPSGSSYCVCLIIPRVNLRHFYCVVWLSVCLLWCYTVNNVIHKCRTISHDLIFIGLSLQRLRSVMPFKS